MRLNTTCFGCFLRRIPRRRADRFVSRENLNRLLKVPVGRLELVPIGDVGRVADPVRDDRQRELVRKLGLPAGPQVVK